MLRIAKQIAPNLDVQDLADEVRERIHEELDYELEAPNTRAVGRAHRGHPFIVVPEVVRDLCRAHVIVMDFVDGVGHDQIARRDQADARPRRRDDLPLLLRRDVPPPRVLRRSASRELAAARRRAHGVPGLRPLQADLGARPPSASSRSSGSASRAAART